MKVENFKQFSLKMLCCKAREFHVGTAICRPFFTPWKTRMHMNLDHMASGHFVLERDVLCEFNYWPLAVSMPPTKVCPQCKDAVPIRRKTDKLHKASERASETRELTLHGQEQNRMRIAILRELRDSDRFLVNNHMHCCAKGLALQCLSFVWH